MTSITRRDRRRALATTSSTSRMEGIVRILSIIRWGAVTAVLTLLVAPAAIGLVTNTRLVEVDGRSMVPTYEFGDLVLIGAPTNADFAPDHVVTVGTPDGSMYTHRIISVTDGEAQLKGDGNDTQDPETVTYDQLVGAVRGHIGTPFASLLAYAQTLPARISLAVLVLALILLPLERREEIVEEADKDTSFSDGRLSNAELDGIGRARG